MTRQLVAMFSEMPIFLNLKKYTFIVLDCLLKLDARVIAQSGTSLSKDAQQIILVILRIEFTFLYFDNCDTNQICCGTGLNL